jgi:inner membrane transporter RhtA
VSALDRSGQPFAVSLVIGGVLSVQLGAALATTLFDDLGPGGTVLLRVGFAAFMLLALWRPAVRGLSGLQRRYVVLFGASLAGMNWAFYGALDRIPLGVAVTLEFVGPLGVAVAASRRARDLLWVAMAAGGILLLAPFPAGSIDALGAGLALVAGGFWAAYILLSIRVGREFSGGSGLALAMAVGAAILILPGLAEAGSDLLRPELLAVGLAVALLSSAIPYSLELEALRRLPQGVFGVLMSLEPAVATAVGFAVLGQALGAHELVAIALVIAGSAGALSTPPATATPEA